MQFVKPITIIIYIRAARVYGFILFLWLVLLSSRIQSKDHRISNARVVFAFGRFISPSYFVLMDLMYRNGPLYSSCTDRRRQIVRPPVLSINYVAGNLGWLVNVEKKIRKTYRHSYCRYRLNYIDVLPQN